MDAVQDGFAAAVRKRASFRGDGPLEAWLWRIVVNAVRDRQRRTRPVAAHPPEDITYDNGHAVELRDRLRAAISMLPERQRLVLYLRYYADLSYAEIADALDISSGTVGATLNAAHASLRRQLEGAAR
jgi:RNA polymerase sigma-70 factor (ECF subfamily)